MNEEKPTPEDEEIPTPVISESLRNGVYANYFSVVTSETDSIIDFGFISPDPVTASKGKTIPGKTIPSRNNIVSRVILSRTGIKKLLEIMNTLLKEPS